MVRKLLAVDIGGTKVSIGIVDENGVILTQQRFPWLNYSAQRLCEELLERIPPMLEENQMTLDQISAIGIGSRGYIDASLRRVAASSIFEKLDVDIVKVLETSLLIPAWIDNDVHAATLAEIRWGAGKRHSSFVYVNLGTGLAVGMVDGGRLIRGASNAAGEAGIMLMQRKNSTQDYEELEMLMAGQGIAAEAKRLLPFYPDSALQHSKELRAQEVFKAGRAGDELALRVVDEACRQTALFLINMSTLLNPAAFVLGGGMADDEWFLDQIIGHIQAVFALQNDTWQVPLEISELGASHASLLGAAAVALLHIKP